MSTADEIKSNLEQRVNAIVNRYKPQIDDLKARGERLAGEFERPGDIGIVLGVDIEIDWQDVEIILDLPSVTMKTNDISLDIPEVSMERQTIIFHTPSVRMERRKVGEYPEFHGLTVRWSPIYIDVPVPFMQEQKIIFDLPSVTMKRQDWKIDIPEFTMERQRWVVGLPQFTVKNISAEASRVKDAGEQLKQEGLELGKRMKEEIDAVISIGQASSSVGQAAAANSLVTAFDAPIAALIKAIDDLVAQKIDPIKVPTEKGDVNLRKQLSELIEQRDALIQKLGLSTPAGAAEPVPA